MFEGCDSHKGSFEKRLESPEPTSFSPSELFKIFARFEALDVSPIDNIVDYFTFQVKGDY